MSRIPILLTFVLRFYFRFHEIDEKDTIYLMKQREKKSGTNSFSIEIT